MGILDWCLLGIVLVFIIMALRYLKKHKNGCGSCHGNCGECKNQFKK